MANISVTYNNRTSDITYPDNNTSTLLAILQDNGYIINSPCGGNGYCNKCTVIVNNNSIKSCSYVPNGNISVIIPPSAAAVSSTYHDKNTLTDNFFSEQDNPVPFSVAIDIGSTSVSVAIIQKTSKSNNKNNIVDIHTFSNPSNIYGSDIISRAQASVSGKKEHISELLISSLESETLYLIKKHNFNICTLDSIYIACNTVMQHLLLSLDCTGLLSYPFKPASFHHTTTYKGYPVIIIPSFCTFVGGDIVSGLYSLSPVPYKTYLFLDIGTNAEIVLVTDNNIYCTSAAAGPAFEATNISCGTSYTNGAINRVSILPCPNSSYKIKYETINNKIATGICGTGVLDIYAHMISLGIIDEYKTLNKSYNDTGFKIAHSVNGPLYITQNDIRQVQLAVSAIRTSITILLSKAEIIESELEHIYISGSFGSSLNPETLKTIEILPLHKLNYDIISYEGNTSLSGAIKASINNCTPDSFDCFINSHNEIDLANEPSFNDLFLKYM